MLLLRLADAPIPDFPFVVAVVFVGGYFMAMTLREYARDRKASSCVMHHTRICMGCGMGRAFEDGIRSDMFSER